MIQSLRKIEETFFGITEDQLNRLYKHYKENPQHFYLHKKDWNNLFSYSRGMMHDINKLMPTLPDYDYNQKLQVMFIDIRKEKYFLFRNSQTVALFDLKNNSCHVYHVAQWKQTGVNVWFNSNDGYGYSGLPSNRFYSENYNPTASDLKLIYQMSEFKYVDFTKLQYVNLYALMNNRFNKEHLWQIEMLVKSEYIKLATELASSYENIDFKVFREYHDFFRLRGKGLWHYREIMKLREKGFNNPEFMFLDTYEYYYNEFWIPFLSEHPEINRNKFIKYIKGRKTSNTIFQEDFLTVYKYYLQYIEKLDLDLSRDKYVFPVELDKEVQEILLIMTYNHRNEVYKKMLINWQAKLPLELRDQRYSDEVVKYKIRTKKEEDERIRRIEERKKAAEKQKRMLELIWTANKNFTISIDDEFVLLAPKSADDLYVEGKTLNHCVYQYLDSIAKKQKAILFVRKKNYSDKPFYTVEVRNGKVVQCRSTNNLDPAKKAYYFSEWVNKHIETIKNQTSMAIC